jgi:hypothetical protein
MTTNETVRTNPRTMAPLTATGLYEQTDEEAEGTRHKAISKRLKLWREWAGKLTGIAYGHWNRVSKAARRGNVRGPSEQMRFEWVDVTIRTVKSTR